MVLLVFSKYSNLTFWRVFDRYGHHNSNSSLRHKHDTSPVATQHKYYTSPAATQHKHHAAASAQHKHHTTPSASSRCHNHISSGAAIQDRKRETAVENVEINKVNSSRRKVLLLLLEGIVEVTVKHQKTPAPDINSVIFEIVRQLQAGTTTTPVFMAADENENSVMTYIVVVLGGIVLALSMAIFIIARCYKLSCAPCVPCAPCEPCAPCQSLGDGDDDFELTTSESTGGHVVADLHMHGQAFDTFFLRTSAHQGCMYKHCAQHIPS